MRSDFSLNLPWCRKFADELARKGIEQSQANSSSFYRVLHVKELFMIVVYVHAMMSVRSTKHVE